MSAPNAFARLNPRRREGRPGRVLLTAAVVAAQLALLAALVIDALT